VATDNFKFNLVSDWKGYNSTRDKTILDPGFLVRGSKNVYKKLSGTIANRPGLLKRGASDTTEAGVKSSFEWETSLGATRVIRVSNNKLQVEYDLVWYELFITSTLVNPAATLTRFVFDPWWDNTEKKDRLLMVNGSSDLMHWSGGIATISGGTLDTITKSDTSKTWAQEGFATNTSGEKKIIIDGVEYTYTGGENTTTLTGVTPNAASLTNGSLAIQAVMSSTNTPAAGFNNDYIRVIGNQAYVGSYTSRVCYVSGSSNFANYTVPTPRGAGDPELLTLDGTGKGIGVRNGHAFISAGISDWYEVSFNDITVGTNLTQQTSVDKKPTAVLSAAYAHEFIDMVGDDIVYLSQDQQLRVIGTFRNLFQSKNPLLSLNVQSEFSEEDFTGGHLRSIGDTIYITAPNNGRDWMHQTREIVDAYGNITAERLWHPPQVRNISRFAVISGVIYGHSNANPMIYQVWDTDQWVDDSSTDEQIPYACVMRTVYSSDKNRLALISFDKTGYEGYMTQGTLLNANIYFDYQGAAALQNVTINDNFNPAKFFSGTVGISFGQSTFGDNPLGDGLTPESNDQELLPKFRAICDVNPTDCFEFAFEIYSTEADCRWEIISVGTNAEESTNQAVFLRR